jgi:hypothetical protein
MLAHDSPEPTTTATSRGWNRSKPCDNTWSRRQERPMSYRDFSLPDVIEKFSLTTREDADLFADRLPVQPSELLVETLRANVPIAVAISNEKVRSELVVAPVLMELKRSHATIGFFSGVDLNADAAAGLTGTCDFLLSLTPEQAYVKAPIITLVEAKRDDLASGIGQCAAEMVGARIFNERAGNAIETVYGAVTTGTTWRFMSLSGSTLALDFNEYSIRDLGKILGILASMIGAQGRG